MLLELCPLSDVVKDAMKRVDITVQDKNLRFCVINLGDDVYVIDDRCTHADFSLSEGFLDSTTKEVECPKHSAVFSIETGAVKCLPATTPVGTYKAIVENDTIFIELEEA